MPKKKFYYRVLLLFILVLTNQLSAAVLVKAKMWPKHSTLNVVFIDGNKQQKQIVMQYAPLWIKNSTLKLNFYDNLNVAPIETHIRISFKLYTGSTLGNHGDLLSRSPTLLLAELSQPELPLDRAKRLILHEFGHALGFEHEYRNPKWPFGQAPILQQISQCISRVQILGYSTEKAQSKCKEINLPLKTSLINTTIYDESSIMNYPLVIKLANNQQKQIAVKSHLSVLDQLAMERWYGK